MNESVIKHLEFVERVIERLAGNSFILKGWAITVVAAILALAAKDTNREFALVALLPAISFWGLDAYYLRRERLFRCLYEDIRKGAGNSDRSNVEAFSLSVSNYGGNVPSWFKTLWSPTIVGIHAVTLLAVVIVLMFLR